MEDAESPAGAAAAPELWEPQLGNILIPSCLPCKAIDRLQALLRDFDVYSRIKQNYSRADREQNAAPYKATKILEDLALGRAPDSGHVPVLLGESRLQRGSSSSVKLCWT